MKIISNTRGDTHVVREKVLGYQTVPHEHDNDGGALLLVFLPGDDRQPHQIAFEWAELTEELEPKVALFRAALEQESERKQGLDPLVRRTLEAGRVLAGDEATDAALAFLEEANVD